jgi:hypothetical protein
MKEMMNLALQSIFVHTSEGFLTCREIVHYGANSFTCPAKEGVLQIFIDLQNSLPSTGFEPTNFGSSGKHAKHYTEED